MRQSSIVRVAVKILVPFILLFGLYVQFHGDFGPGGGFQAGVIFAAAFILYSLVFGLQAARRVARPAIIETLIALGLLIYAGTGVVTLLLGGNFLEYNVLNAHHPTHGQHWGIFAVELGVGITVFAAMVTIFFSFAGYRRRRTR